MAFGALFGGHSEESDNQRELLELRRQHTSLNEAYDRGKVEYDQVVAATQEDQKELSASREQNMALQTRIIALENELQACKDDLFRLQPMGHDPDSTIAQRFENLDDMICDWVDMEISRCIDESRSKDPDMQPKLFYHNGDSLMKTFLTQYPDWGGEYFIRSMLHRHFQKKLFADRVFLFGLNVESVGWLKWVEQSMSGLQPPRETATIRTWRSETLTSIAKTSDFSADVRRAGCQLASELFDELSGYFPVVSGRSKSLDTFHEKVVKVAVELAVSMQTSTVLYSFEPKMSGGSRLKRYVIPMNHLGQYRMIDVATGKTLKPDSAVESDRNGNIGDQIMVLSPRMFRCDKDKQVPLVKAIVLVELYKPLGRRRAATAELEDRME